MAASPLFGKMAIPLFLEKFVTAVGPAMVCHLSSFHSKRLLIDSERFDVDHGCLFPYIWTTSRRGARNRIMGGNQNRSKLLIPAQRMKPSNELTSQILYQSDKSIELASLSALESLMQALYPNPRDTPTGLAQDIIKECLKLLEQPDKSQSLAATKSLVAMFNSTGKSRS